MMEPLSVAVHSVSSLGKLKSGQNVIVFGAGPVGLLIMAVAKALGAKKIVAVDINEERLKFAKGYAATHTFVPVSAVFGLSLGAKLNLVFCRSPLRRRTKPVQTTHSELRAWFENMPASRSEVKMPLTLFWKLRARKFVARSVCTSSSLGMFFSFAYANPTTDSLRLIFQRNLRTGRYGCSQRHPSVVPRMRKGTHSTRLFPVRIWSSHNRPRS